MGTEIKYNKRVDISAKAGTENSVVLSYILPNVTKLVTIPTVSPYFNLITGNPVNLENIAIQCNSNDFDIYIKNREDDIDTTFFSIHTIYWYNNIVNIHTNELNKRMLNYNGLKYTNLIVVNNDGVNDTGPIRLTLTLSQI